MRLGSQPYFYDGSYRQIWHDNNHGASSGLDADLLDGLHASSFVRNSNNNGHLLQFGSGSNTGHTSSSYAYAIFQEGGAWSHPYPDLRINYHTGIVMAVGASNYGGLRFQRDYNDATELMSIGNGDNHVRIANNIYISGNAYIGSNNYSFRNGNNNRNLAFYAGGSGDIGISGYDSGGNWKFQLYGTSGAYGFLNANWSSWDIKKTLMVKWNSELVVLIILFGIMVIYHHMTQVLMLILL